MLNSAECLLQGAKCLECPLKQVRIESSQHFTRDAKMLCNTELMDMSDPEPFSLSLSPPPPAFFLILYLIFSLFNKICVMPLSSVYFRAEDSTGSVVVRSTLPSEPLWFCCNQHIQMQRSSAPHTAGRHHGDLLSRDCT